MSPMMIMGIVLAISLAGNGFLFWSRDNAIEEKAAAVTSATAWEASSTTCTNSVDQLAKDGDKRHKALLGAITSETQRIKGLQHEAIAAQRARPDNPQDLCGSLLRYWQDQVKREKGGGK